MTTLERTAPATKKSSTAAVTPPVVAPAKRNMRPYQPPADASVPHLIPKTEMLRRVSLSYPTIWNLIRRGEFPQQFRVGGRSLWRADEVTAWIESRPRGVHRCHFKTKAA